MKRRPLLMAGGLLALGLALLAATGCVPAAAPAPTSVPAAIATQVATATPGAIATRLATTTAALSATQTAIAAPALTMTPAASMTPTVTTTVDVATSPTYGSYLSTPAGLPLYTYSGDSPGKSTVTGTLLAAWPPFTASGTLTLPPGVPGTLSQITRPDGTQQVAYNDLPLYTFVRDTPGNVTGQGVRGFQLVTVAGPGTPTATRLPSPTAAMATPAPAGTATPGT